MGLVFIDELVISNEEYNLIIPQPEDFSLPSIPPLPPIEFPSVPNLISDLNNLITGINKLKTLQNSVPSKSVDFGGEYNYETGTQVSKTTSLPSSSINFDDFIDKLTENFPVSLPSIPPLPPIEFPSVPNFSDMFGDLGINPKKFYETMNNPDYPEYGYKPSLPRTNIKVFKNGNLVPP